jgi:hypothetical protein
VAEFKLGRKRIAESWRDQVLRAKIAAVEDQMRVKLEEIRATLHHAGGKGYRVEEMLRSFLRDYLPRRLEVGHGEIIDTLSNRSSQTDIAIVTEEHPFTFTRDLPSLFFIEGVCGAGEAKAVLDKPELTATVEKARRFKSLKARRAPGTLFSGNIADRDRFYTSPAYFLIAMESKISLETTAAELGKDGHYGAEGYTPGLDAAFIVDRGWVIDFGDGKGSLQFRQPNGESVRGWVFHDSDSVLFDLLGWLSSVMLRTLRFEPILPHYLVEEWR